MAILYELGSTFGHDWQDRIRAKSRAEIACGTLATLQLAVIKETSRLHAPFPTAFPCTITTRAETAIPSLPAPLPIGTGCCFQRLRYRPVERGLGR